MFRRHPKLLFLLPIVTLILLPIVLTKWVGGDHGAWSVLSMFLLPVSMVPLAHRVDRLEVNLKQADQKRRLEPVQQTVDRCWVMVEKKEPEYQHRLLKHILHTSYVAAKPDSPLPTGTKVDAYMEFGDEEMADQRCMFNPSTEALTSHHAMGPKVLAPSNMCSASLRNTT